ncbi:hypothetical protein HYPSUDRAFT_421771 [Hypholoma sublateritium FD-334 SS-4]|uniref:Uncharacterized protein n=1 Tax=Hypholoma sublateritium (strain FD-334 SS-4) TaxID=945553 RepID=A0A0D2MMY2_HYPSF|nr:hypothetical protein HYPSUDRAFT_421771 [Hypholoma sublateritium FD-334 SS-4]
MNLFSVAAMCSMLFILGHGVTAMPAVKSPQAKAMVSPEESLFRYLPHLRLRP